MDEPTGPLPLWDDADAFFSLMASRGWTWVGVLTWLKAPPTAGFFEVPIDQRRRAAEHLERLIPLPGNASGK